VPLPKYADALALLAGEEGGEGWLSYCKRRGIYQLPTAEWVDALAGAILPLGAERPVEVGAGSGELGRALIDRGIPFALTGLGGTHSAKTDPAKTGPEGGSERLGGVERLGAREALERHRPDLVLSCWLPFDSGAEEMILADPGVRWYLAVVQTGPGFAGSEALWRNPAWRAVPIGEADRWSVSRSDYLSEVTAGEHARHGAAFLLTRQAP
jgi:hypothetical protein